MLFRSKSKHNNHKSYTTNFTNGNITVDFGCNRVKLPKLKGIKAKLHRNFIGQIKSATISQVPSGKYYVSSNSYTVKASSGGFQTTGSVGSTINITDMPCAVWRRTVPSWLWKPTTWTS